MSSVQRDARLVRLNLGCGLDFVPGWVNVDNSWNARLAQWPRVRAALHRVGLISHSATQVPWSLGIATFDVTQGLPYAAGSVECIYTSMLITEMPLAAGRRFLAEAFRVLRPGGILRVVTKDITSIARQYLAALDQPGVASEMPADLFQRRLGYGWRETFSLMDRLKWRPASYGLRQYNYDRDSLSGYLTACGFRCEEKQFRQSSIPAIDAVERHEFIDAFCIEATKPMDESPHR